MLIPQIYRHLKLVCVVVVGLGIALQSRAQTVLAIYTDSLVNGWGNWSWNTTCNFSNTGGYVHSGSASISATITSGGSALSLATTPFNSTPYTNLTFWINGGATGGQKLQIYAEYYNANNVDVSGAIVSLSTLATNTWQQFNITLARLGVANQTNFYRFTIQDRSGSAEPTFYVDDIQLTPNPPPSLVHVGVNAGQVFRTADARWFGLNTAVWDGYFDTPTTSSALAELGTGILRFPGGSLSDDYNWASNTTDTNTWTWNINFNNFVHIATNASVKAQAIITVNYGSGTAREAAAWVTNANISNHYGFKYWEVGNECYGTWENDTNANAHDPYTYGVRAAQYITQMKAADPTIKIGVPVVPGEDNNDNGYSSHPAYNARTGTYHNGWTPVVLSTLLSLGVTPDFLVHHVYPESGSDSDAALLQDTGNWAGDAASLRQMITDYIGTPVGTNIELLCTENNADSGPEGKQSTSIVNGLYQADSLAQMMKTEFNSFVWWDLRNGTDIPAEGGDFDASLYGWRTYGDLGIINGLNTRHPTFFTFKLMQYFARPGESILNATSDYSLLTAYATRKADGALALLVINKASNTNLNAQITLTNFSPWSTATMRSFGIAQDEATRTNSTIPGSQDIATNSFSSAAIIFTNTFPPYSATLITLAPAAPVLQTISATGGQYVFQLQGQAGVPYVIQNSADMVSWSSAVTNTLSGSTLNVTNNVDQTMTAQFWRAVWLP